MAWAGDDRVLTLCSRVPLCSYDAKGLLLASIRDPNPVLFMEPKWIYRQASERVPTGDYELPLGQARVVKEGADVTVVGYGAQMLVLERAVARAEAEFGISCELIDLRTIAPWDAETVCASVEKTGRAVVSHEAPRTGGFAAEISSVIQERCFLSLEAPVERVVGLDIPHPLIFEQVIMPNESRIVEGISKTLHF